MAEKADVSRMSEDSVDFLKEVKKGKPRKFAMICKGVQIVSLVVYKKGTTEKFKKEAKETGTGQFYFGVIEGKGQNLRFKLARADGFEEGPTKKVTLKQFLIEHAEMKTKPQYEIVDSLAAKPAPAPPKK